MSIWRTLVFAFKEQTAMAGWRDKHLANVTAAIKDAIPIVDRYHAQVAPNSEAVKQVATALKSGVDPANPQAGDEFSPTNPNLNAG